MRWLLRYWALVPAILLALASCGYDDVRGNDVTVRHSALLRIVECDGYTAVEIRNPWGEGLFERYLLVPYDSAVPSSLPRGTLLRTPLRNVILFSGVHASLLEELGVLNSVSGVCDRRYIYSDAVQKALTAGGVRDCGSSLNVDAEAVADVSPDAIFVLPFENGGYGKLDKMPFPLVACADYMENSPLGCAEWMRFYGRLLGCAEKSDSLFDAVCAEYERLRSAAASVSSRPRLMCELKSSSAWYVPGGGSTMGRMYMDAGADYIFAGYGSNGSVPLSFEVVLDKAADADIWLFKYNSEKDMTCSAMLAAFAGYSHFRPFREGNVYACNTHRKHLFEESSFHPERLLAELVAILHPSLSPGKKSVYYEKVQ
jgi:iron complex transport system substrate-binding protein